MDAAHAESLFKIEPGGGFEWFWTDWLGVVAVFIGIAFLLTVIVALIRGEPPLVILKIICGPLTSIFSRGSKEDTSSRLDPGTGSRH